MEIKFKLTWKKVLFILAIIMVVVPIAIIYSYISDKVTLALFIWDVLQDNKEPIMNVVQEYSGSAKEEWQAVANLYANITADQLYNIINNHALILAGITLLALLLMQIPAVGEVAILVKSVLELGIILHMYYDLFAITDVNQSFIAIIFSVILYIIIQVIIAFLMDFIEWGIGFVVRFIPFAGPAVSAVLIAVFNYFWCAFIGLLFIIYLPDILAL